jgi:aspartate aminotransferase
MKLAERVGKIKPSPTMAMAAQAKAMAARGIDVVDFSLGEPDFDTPDLAKEAAIEAIRRGYTKYTPPGGGDDLKEAVRAKLQKENGLTYEKNQIIVSCGAKHSLYNIAQVLYERGDEVIIPAPYWVSYPDQVILNDATPVIIKTKEENRFLLTPDLLERAITPRSKVLILNSPSNPTGSAFDAKTIEGIAEIALRHRLIVISDEIYEKILYDGKKHVSIASLGQEILDRTIVVNGVSKSFSMTGWRIGYAAGPKEIIGAMTTVQSQSTSNPTSISQKAAVAALEGGEAFTRKMVEEFDRRRRYSVERLNRMKGITCQSPDGAFYLFPNIFGLLGRSKGNLTLKGSGDVANYLLQEAHVSTVAGDAFGSDRHLRISYAVPMETLEKGMDRIEEAVGRLG